MYLFSEGIVGLPRLCEARPTSRKKTNTLLNQGTYLRADLGNFTCENPKIVPARAREFMGEKIMVTTAFLNSLFFSDNAQWPKVRHIGLYFQRNPS
jgi:hypothetical protein